MCAVIARSVMHGFHHSFELHMTLSLFCLEVSVELLQGIKPRLKSSEEIKFFVTGVCLSNKSKVHSSFNMVLKFGIIREWICITEQGVFVSYSSRVTTEGLIFGLGHCI